MRDRHHRIPKSRGGKHKTEKGTPNLIKVSRKHHVLYHQLFGNMLAHEIAEWLNEWIDPDLMFVVIRREE